MTDAESGEASDHGDEELVHNGICPVCGEEFTDGFDDIAEAESVEGVRLCVIEKDSDAEIGDCLLHLPEDQEGYDIEEDPDTEWFKGATEDQISPEDWLRCPYCGGVECDIEVWGETVVFDCNECQREDSFDV